MKRRERGRDEEERESGGDTDSEMLSFHGRGVLEPGPE